jgi:PAS domain S-box-containing protein
LVSQNNSLAIRYGLAVVAVVLCILIGHVPLFEHMWFGLFFFAVAVIAWCAGIGPGVLATGLSVLALAFFFVSSSYSLFITDGYDLLRLSIFFLGGLVVNALARENWSSQAENQSLWADLNAARDHAARSRAALEALADSLNGPIVLILDPRGSIASWYPAAEKVTGYSSQQALGRPWEFLAPAGAPPEKPATRPEANPSGGLDEVRWLLRGDGSRLPAQVAVIPLRSASGAPLGGFLMVVRALLEPPHGQT